MNCLSVLIVILLTSNLLSALYLLGESLRGPPPCINSPPYESSRPDYTNDH